MGRGLVNRVKIVSFDCRPVCVGECIRLGCHKLWLNTLKVHPAHTLAFPQSVSLPVSLPRPESKMKKTCVENRF